MPVDEKRIHEEATIAHTKANRMKAVTIIIATLLTVGILLLAGSATYAVIQGRSVNERLCESSKEQRRALRELLIFIRDRSLLRADSSDERQFIRAEYTAILQIVPPVTCGSSGSPRERSK